VLFQDREPHELTQADLDSLIDAGVCERRDVEFKAELPGQSGQQKKEFLADVSSFANTVGGWIFYGIEEEEGVASSLEGCGVPDADQLVLKLENLVRTGVSPRIPYFDVAPVGLDSGRFVIAMRIRRSFALPHRVILRDHSKFYARNSAGKFPMDVSELRTAFTQGQQLADRVREYRRDRLAAIQAGETPLTIRRDATIALHVLPLAAFESATDLLGMDDLLKQESAFHPILGARMGSRLTSRGLLTYTASTNEPSDVLGYSHLHKDGTIEAVSVELLGSPGDLRDPEIDATSVEKHVIKVTLEYLSILDEMGVVAPYYIMLSFLGVKGRTIWRRNPLVAKYAKSILEDQLLPPEVFLNAIPTDVAPLLRPALESLWHASGFRESPNYLESGEWSQSP